MRLKVITFFILSLMFLLQACSVTGCYPTNKSAGKELASEILDEVSQEELSLSDDLLLIPSLFVQAENDGALEAHPNDSSMHYKYNGKIKSDKTSLCYDEITVEITPMDGYTTEEIVDAFTSDLFTAFKVDGEECCAVFIPNEAVNQTVVNLLFFTQSETSKCFVATKVDGILDSTKSNVKKVYKDFMLTRAQEY